MGYTVKTLTITTLDFLREWVLRNTTEYLIGHSNFYIQHYEKHT
jgi:hypothetical protein